MFTTITYVIKLKNEVEVAKTGSNYQMHVSLLFKFRKL